MKVLLGISSRLNDEDGSVGLFLSDLNRILVLCSIDEWRRTLIPANKNNMLTNRDESIMNLIHESVITDFSMGFERAISEKKSINTRRV